MAKNPTPADSTGEASIDYSSRMHKFSLYETSSRFYLVGADLLDRHFRILKIERSVEPTELDVSDDGITYTKNEMNQLLNTVDDGNKGSGGLRLRSSTWGLLGFIRFTGEYYMLLITKRSQVALLGGHYVYQIDGTELISLASPHAPRLRPERHVEETRFVNILKNLDLSRSFYFCYSYDITNTLQRNICREREERSCPEGTPNAFNFNQMFIWNHYLLEPARRELCKVYDWCLPIIHGFVDQAILSVYGRTVYVTLIARRSRYFAGARFLKRGANDLGYVANDVETEQIVAEMLTTSFHAPGARLFSSPNYTSFVQHRGSIPLYWTQDNSGVSPKPDIDLNLVDPFYSAAALHFDNLFERYGGPIFALNLIKARERTPRESKLLTEYTHAIAYLNQFLPNERKILYRNWDMSRASKSRDQAVIDTLEKIAREVLRVTSFFHNGDDMDFSHRLQNGVARTNCIDCLDRTNAAQFVIGKFALGSQLLALGVVEDASIDYDTDAINLFMNMYHDHGDTIAVQYGGSHLVNTMETYRKINQWTSQPRDMVESFKRYYNNSFVDGQRQEAYNLFLGNYIFAQGQPMLWDLSTDYYLHHADPRKWSANSRKSYTRWFSPEYLAPSRPEPVKPKQSRGHLSGSATKDDYWLEYYRPSTISSFLKMFSFRMKSTLRYIPLGATAKNPSELSPFFVRINQERDGVNRARTKKGVKIAESPDMLGAEDYTGAADKILSSLQTSEQRSEVQMRRSRPGILKELQLDNEGGVTTTQNTPNTGYLKDRAAAAQWTFNQFVVNSLAPVVSANELAEYGRYISHPLNLPLVTSSDDNGPTKNEFLAYIHNEQAELMPATDSFEGAADFAEYLIVDEAPLTVTEADTPKKRYKAYRQWLKGKSLFKQPRTDT